MKKIALLLGILFYLFFQHINAQSLGINFGDLSNPVPSVSGSVNYTNSPPSNATGIPDISFPLAALSTYNPNIKLNTAISYDPNSAAQGSPATQVGSGWSLFTPGVISRHINLLPDELLPNNISGSSNEVYFDDVYYYNIPGVFGKFRFKRNVQNNTFELINLSPNKLRIEYTRADNSTKLTVKDFTITDNHGVRYLFKDYSLSNFNDTETLVRPEGVVYRSAFFVSQIIDANGVELASFSYQKDIKYREYHPNTIDYQTCRIKTITANGFGKLDFEYVYNSGLENTMNDPYQLQNVVLKDYYHHIISKYEFEYTSSNYVKRELTKLKKINRSNELQEAIEFAYKTITLPPPANPHQKPSGICPNTFEAIPWSQNRVLNKVINPYGGVVEYNFEFAQVYYDKASPDYINPIKNETVVSNETHYVSTLLDIPYNTNQSREYTFVVPGNYPRKVFTGLGIDELYPLDPLGSFFDEPYLDYTVDGIAGTVCGLDYNGFRSHSLQPGSHTLKISGTGGKGSVGILVLEYVPFPYPNKDYSPYMVRISDIKYYIDKTGTTPAKTIKYDYDDFSDANSSSGYWASADQDVNSSYILYKNVKVSDSDDSNGYTKYYYKMSDDFPKIGNYHPYYALTCGGLLDKKEVYDNQNKLLVSEKNEYTFEEIPGAQEYYIKHYDAYYGTVSKPAWLKKNVNTVISNFDNNQSVQESSETEFNAYNFEIASTKETEDGVTTETLFTYPTSSGAYSNLFSKNMIGIPVIQETKEEGKTVSKSETKFDIASSTLPTSIQTTNINDGSTKTAVTFDLYDEKGNLLQMTSSTGIPTAIVYGYDKTLSIAKIQGAAYAQVLPYIQAIVDASNADAADPANEPALLMALDNFRKNTALKDFTISTNTYDPLIGMTTITSSNGIREIYMYNADNKLLKITDRNGKVLKEYKYNYKN
ncbi:hypothetical protein AB670_03146 [Chryseobacterium sp. MOF25P]|uniref:hypothetical protein n=1 Tax=unclassified Chryseobacterium TaxID=2593645 RepID=UPI0008058DAB|nr:MULTISPECIES: hypothetical protein [unclassified Chryseobacterium]OBW40522.1 hypothetical protein AB670_03146 [Chryseobacterium sp. MOF25P]OBW45842.1 hypothetical protein AB671_02034 [Chryseobacterium sp. BGARF1]